MAFGVIAKWIRWFLASFRRQSDVVAIVLGVILNAFDAFRRCFDVIVNSFRMLLVSFAWLLTSFWRHSEEHSVFSGAISASKRSYLDVFWSHFNSFCWPPTSFWRHSEAILEASGVIWAAFVVILIASDLILKAFDVFRCHSDGLLCHFDGFWCPFDGLCCQFRPESTKIRSSKNERRTPPTQIYQSRRLNLEPTQIYSTGTGGRVHMVRIIRTYFPQYLM